MILGVLERLRRSKRFEQYCTGIFFFFTTALNGGNLSHCNTHGVSDAVAPLSPPTFRTVQDYAG